ncbi:MAG: DNA recombination protein RmuC [Candidatus Gracilibacteria bacterium]|nr:DNA recombination protein RmuC [Candidatus Gracilibacteria bacterium]
MDLTTILLIVIAVALGGVIVLQLRPKSGGDPKIFDEFSRDREARFRESEALKTELRETTKFLQSQFHQVNRTVDSRLSESSKQLNERLDKSSVVIGKLERELGKMNEVSATIKNLDRILRAPKGRGSLGEQSLEEILKSVFPVNLWSRQVEIGRTGMVDAVVRTSNGMIPIDAKFPLPAFEALVNAENETSSDTARREFEKNVKSRINEVAKYIQPGEGTLDFAILFLPNENIYYEAAIRSPDLSEFARTKKVLITGPNTMLYVLQAVLQAYQSQQFAAQAREALAQLAGVKNQAKKLDEAVLLVARHLGHAHKSVEGAQKENQKLQDRLEKVASLEEGLEQEEAAIEAGR